ncbi:MAG: YitT family protein [Saprospiraceae bacterium]
MELNKIKNIALEVGQIAFAIFLASVGLKMFLLPNGFLDGGATGIAILLSELFHLDISVLLPIVSIPFFIIGYFTIDKNILIKSFLAILCLSLVIHFENFEPITNDKLIIATFGGLFLGTGIGIAIRNGAVLDGSEMLGIYVNNKFGISIGAVILLFNIGLFGITALVLTPEVAMYSILTYIITGKAVDFTIQGFENYVGLMIISNKSKALQDAFHEKVGHGITVYQGVKGYGKRGFNENNEIIHLIVNRIDVKRLHRMIDEIDKTAFIIEFDVNDVKGGKIKRYLSKT